MLVNLQNQEQKIKIISLSAFLENQEAFLKKKFNRKLSAPEGDQGHLCYYHFSEISDLEILLNLTLSENGKSLPIPYPQFYREGDQIDRYNYTDWKEIYRNKLLALVFNLGEEGKEIYQGEHGLSSGEL
jgi:hypothetical protein